MQTDRRRYHAYMKHLLERTRKSGTQAGRDHGLSHAKTAACSGVCHRSWAAFYGAKAVVVATGTYLGGRIFVGEASYASGPDGQHAASAADREPAGRGHAAAPVQDRHARPGTPPQHRF
ncbi:MAG: FAD-dependent oxidoreductase [Oscillospiraceae bacterium]